MQEWIGVDFDGTLATYPSPANQLGDPVPLMVARVKKWLKIGHPVKIVTARVGPCDPGDEHLVEESRADIKAWCLKHLGQELEVVAHKDYGMHVLWDDRAERVESNTGRLISFDLLGDLQDERTHVKLTLEDGKLCAKTGTGEVLRTVSSENLSAQGVDLNELLYDIRTRHAIWRQEFDSKLVSPTLPPDEYTIAIDRGSRSWAIFKDDFTCVHGFIKYTSEAWALREAKAWVAQRSSAAPKISYPGVSKVSMSSRRR